MEEGETYVFRVRAANEHGVGKPSQLSEPVCARALPGNDQSQRCIPRCFCRLSFQYTVFFAFAGTKEIEAGVDEETGDIFLSLEACEISETSKFVWSKNYQPIGECPRVAVTNKGRT